MIKVSKVTKAFHSIAVNNFSYCFKDNGLYVILGHSGSGKSTLLNMISGLTKPNAGDILIDGVNLYQLNNFDSQTYKLANIGYVFQDFKLLPLLSVEDNVIFNLDAFSSLSKDNKNKMLKDVLKYVELPNKNRALIQNLSGGEKQRVAIARAIITNPKILLCDEPTGALDNKNAENIFSLLKEYSKSHLVIVVSHDEENSKKFADIILSLSDGKLIKETILNENLNKPEFVLNVPRKKFFGLSLPLRIRAGKQKIKAKKWRSIFTNLITSFSLLSLGIGIIIGTSLKDQIVGAFKDVVSGNEIIVTKKTNTPEPFSSFISSDEKTVREIKDRYQDYLYDMGVTYLNNFTQFFASRDEVYFQYLDQFKIVLPSFYSASFVNYEWAEEKVIKKFYPSRPDDLSCDEVVLGLTYQDMVNLCLSLHIERSYEALGNFIKEKDVVISLNVANDEWQYEDSQYLSLKAIYNSLSSEVYHTEHTFNEYLFESQMRFPTTLDIRSEPYYPYTFKKVYTLHTLESPTGLIEALSVDPKFNDIVLERRESYLLDQCVAFDNCLKNVLFVFTIDKDTVNIADISTFKKVATGISNYYLSSNLGYQMHSSGMLAGFSQNIAFSLDENKVEDVGDYFSRQLSGDMEDFPGVAVGNIMRYNNNGVLFSSDLNNITLGSMPKDYNEIVVSQGLLDFLNVVDNPINTNLYYSFYNQFVDAVVVNSFTICGVKNDSKICLYHYPLFTVSFFRDKLGISSFNLLPTNVVLSLSENADMGLTISTLTNNFKNYRFVCPLDAITASVDDVMTYVKTIALIFVAVSMVITLLLLSLIAYLNAIESESEINLLRHIGHNRQTIVEYICSNAIVSAIITGIMAVIELIIFQFMFSVILNQTVGGGLTFSFSLLPFVAVIGCAFLMPIFSSVIITNIILKKINKNFIKI